MNPRDKPREQALEILRSVEDGGFVDSLLDHSREVFDARDSAFILELVYGTLRNRAWLDWVLNLFSAQPVAKTDVRTRNILRLGAYQLLLLDRVPPSAAINTSTELAKAFGKKQGYVNGLLRNLDRKRSSISEPRFSEPAKRLAVLYSHPEWLVRRWLTRFGGEQAETLLRENNRPAPLVVRANILKATRDELKASLVSQGAQAVETNYSDIGLEILSSPGIRTLDAYQQGFFMVQDEAAQLVGLMLAPAPGETVLDACAAPGGKATHLAELMQNRGTIVALEIDRTRMNRIVENSLRLGSTIIAPRLGDAALYLQGGFDKILIDAPCSGLGVLRRHPDGRWSKSEQTIRERQRLQSGILKNCAKLLRPGGAMVYATCSTEPEENEDVVQAFLSGMGTGFVIDDARRWLPKPAQGLVDERGFFHTYPRAFGMDGFFGVRMIKK
ncbi:MAG: 16S rRNA (cytosine(967)-C(5))-methyltransferase RsmB [Nitrospiraceae bacterium]|nr:16S rRNA (cytosine(967)-C(5))-methyltransferase RsmB [Nitrospiraceae bacterium]